MDLSRVPELELRKQIQAKQDAADAIEANIKAISDKLDGEYEVSMQPLREQMRALRKALDAKVMEATKALRQEEEKLDAEIDALLGTRYVSGTCDITGLPIFDDDETVETTALACVVDEQKEAA